MSAPRRSRYDAVIVGGGHNGLVAAAYLARAGRSCVVLERREAVGGAAVSERPFEDLDARLSRYAYLVSLLPQQIVDELGLRVTLARRAVSSYTPDPRTDAAHGLLVDAGDEAAARASFQRVTGAGSEFSTWTRFHGAIADVAARIFPTLIEPLRSRAELRRIAGDDAVWEALVETPLGESVAAAFADDLVRGVVLTDGLIGTFASAGEPDLRQNRCFLLHVVGRGTGEWLVPIGGMGAVTAALRAAALGAGAELCTGAAVTAVGEREVRVATCDGGEHAIGADWILAAVAPAELDRLRRHPAAQPAPEGAQLKVNLLLSRLPRLRDERVEPGRAFAGTFHVNETGTQLQAAYDEAAAGRIPSLPPCEAYCHTLTDRSILGPGLAAAGAHTMTLFGLHMPARLFGGDGSRERALEATLRSLDSVLAEPIAGCLLTAPGGEPCIEVRAPPDLERELRLPGGHIFHRDLAWPFAEDPADVGRWGVETDDPSLLLCGAGARRGGGVSGIPGRNAAMAVLS
ncbi:MAG TPA: NAD(P)/FAD-dependent oxidoreductase [Solirubrobacteraceae bacterium]|nr:NAD(P)/FAD-dependent oxidoreductase [Solirubrobacteraceae bacterium]